MKELVKVKILFKSGNVLEEWFEDFGTEYSGDDLTKCRWKTVKGQKIMFISLPDIECIYITERKKGWKLWN